MARMSRLVAQDLAAQAERAGMEAGCPNRQSQVRLDRVRPAKMDCDASCSGAFDSNAGFGCDVGGVSGV